MDRSDLLHKEIDALIERQRLLHQRIDLLKEYLRLYPHYDQRETLFFEQIRMDQIEMDEMIREKDELIQELKRIAI